MKKIIMLIAFLSILIGTNAQKIAEETVENINTKQAIQIIEAAAKELNYSIDKFDSQKMVLITKFFEWNSVAITNHAKLKFEVKDNTVLISMIERQYKSDKGWLNSPTNLSKRNHKKYIGFEITNLVDSAPRGETIKRKLPTIIIETLEFIGVSVPSFGGNWEQEFYIKTNWEV